MFFGKPYRTVRFPDLGLGNNIHSHKQQSRPYGPAPTPKSKWPQSQLQHSIEGQGSFYHCYSIFKFVFFQALLGTHGADIHISITLWIVWRLKVAYVYALEPFRKPPDPRQVSMTALRLLVTLVDLYFSLLNQHRGPNKSKFFLRNRLTHHYEMIFDPYIKMDDGTDVANTILAKHPKHNPVDRMET